MGTHKDEWGLIGSTRDRKTLLQVFGKDSVISATPWSGKQFKTRNVEKQKLNVRFLTQISDVQTSELVIGVFLA